MNEKIPVVISGVHGYVGAEVAKLVLNHPALSLMGVIARQTQQDLYGELSFLEANGIPLVPVEQIHEDLIKPEVLFLATPPEISMTVAKMLAQKEINIIDLSGAFRLSREDFERWYNLEHHCHEILSKAVYGLCPWNTKKESTVISNPGCYATCALMTLIPLLREDIIQSDEIIIDAKSGISGAGRHLKSDLMFCEMANNFYPYKIGEHQHTPEIEKGLFEFSQKACKVILTTHLLPIARGISMSIYTKAIDHSKSDEEILNAVKDAFTTAYHDYPLVTHGVIQNQESAKEKYLLSLKSVIGTAKIHISYFVKDRRIRLFSCIDNLLKGAASQAIENLNALYNLPLMTGLSAVEEFI